MSGRDAPALHDHIRANNAVWAAMYYDEVVDTDDYQLTYMAGAEAGYYNCAQAVSRSGPRVLAAIETFYRARGLPPAVYLDPESAPGLRADLDAAGYVEVPGEEENWWSLDLAAAPPRSPEAVLHIDAARVREVPLDGPGDPLFDAFLHVDGAANDLPDRVVQKLAHNLRSRRAPGIELRCSLALVDGEPAASCLVGLSGRHALFAECGTLPRHRRLGLYSFLVLSGLAFARARGARFALLTAAASASSNPATRKLGFDLLCTRTFRMLPLE